ncbi:hypothetical protein ACIA98_16845 [Streptomyces sp. NPDC051366]|uniref:hypothetical protein n=1 Tax=Streptomyces sp. NPDC051366 TaxID=3365652 RepID=UPI0037BDF561
MLTYASGRTWVVADHSHSRLIAAEAGARRLALFGEASIDAGRVARLMAQHDRAANLIPGDVAKLIDTMRRAKVLE